MKQDWEPTLWFGSQVGLRVYKRNHKGQGWSLLPGLTGSWCEAFLNRTIANEVRWVQLRWSQTSIPTKYCWFYRGLKGVSGEQRRDCSPGGEHWGNPIFFEKCVHRRDIVKPLVPAEWWSALWRWLRTGVVSFLLRRPSQGQVQFSSSRCKIIWLLFHKWLHEANERGFSTINKEVWGNAWGKLCSVGLTPRTVCIGLRPDLIFSL